MFYPLNKYKTKPCLCSAENHLAYFSPWGPKNLSPLKLTSIQDRAH